MATRFASSSFRLGEATLYHTSLKEVKISKDVRPTKSCKASYASITVHRALFILSPNITCPLMGLASAKHHVSLHQSRDTSRNFHFTRLLWDDKLKPSENRNPNTSFLSLVVSSKSSGHRSGSTANMHSAVQRPLRSACN